MTGPIYIVQAFTFSGSMLGLHSWVSNSLLLQIMYWDIRGRYSAPDRLARRLFGSKKGNTVLTFHIQGFSLARLSIGKDFIGKDFNW
jgi:hypothetical protein